MYLLLVKRKFQSKNLKWLRNISSYKQETKCQNVNLPSFFICGSELLNLSTLCVFGAKTSISGV